MFIGEGANSFGFFSYQISLDVFQQDCAPSWQIDAKSQTAILCFKQLTHHLQTVYRLLNRLSWIPIHQVAMHHDPCFCKVAELWPPAPSLLIYQFQQTV
jgi:hypothetical protein